MPISVLCPACSAPVTAPDAAAGKRAKCPKCAALMILPGGAPEPTADDPPPRKRPRVEEDEGERPVKKSPRRRDEDDEADEEDERPARKSARRREEDEEEERPAKKSSRRIAASDDEDEEERPRKKSRRDNDEDDDDDRPRKKGKGNAKKKSGPPVPLLIGGGLVLLLLVAGGLYFAFSGGNSSGTGGGGGGGGGGAKGPNWVAFAAPDGSFTTAFPDAAPTETDLESLLRQTQNANATPEEIKMAKDMMTAFKIKVDGWGGARGGRKYLVVVTTNPPSMPIPPNMDAVIDQAAKISGATIVAKNPFSHGGLHGMHFTLHNPKSNKWIVSRQALVGKGKSVSLSVVSDTELKDDDAEAKQFFEKFQWKG